MKAADTGNWLDFEQLSRTRAAARATGANAEAEQKAALRGVARQFEAVFVNMMLESMRSATPGDPLFDNSESDSYRDLLDRQLSLEMADSGGIGIADMLVRQLSPIVRQASGAEAATNPFADRPATGAALAPADARANEPRTSEPPPHRLDDRLAPMAAASAPTSAEATGWRLVEEGEVRVYALRRPEAPIDVRELAPVNGVAEREAATDPQRFVEQVWPHAERVAAQLGVEPGVLVAQAALETGWGRHVMRDGNGASSHNLFGIKADERWPGASVNVATLENEGGVVRRVRAPFRAYESLAASFDDYARFVTGENRYRQTLEATRAAGGDAETYIRSLHAAGYATDPDYPDKVLDVMRRTLAALNAGDTRSL